MNADASNVDAINILHITECLLPSCIASFEYWSNIFRTRSFTLCKNDRDFHERSDSVAVLSISSSSTTNLYVCWVNKPTGCSLTGFPLLASNISSDFHSWEDHFLSVFPFWVIWWASAHYRSLRSWLLLIPRAQRYLTFISGLPRSFWCSRGKLVRSPYAASRDQIHHRIRFCCDSFFTWIFLRSFRHHFKTIGRTEMANVEQTQKMIPFITCEIALCQYVCESVFGVNVFDLDFGVHIDSIEQQIKSNSVGSGNMSHCGASSLYDHLDHCFVVFKHMQQSVLTRRIDVWGNKINIVQIINHSMRFLSFLKFVRCCTNLT